MHLDGYMGPWAVVLSLVTPRSSSLVAPQPVAPTGKLVAVIFFHKPFDEPRMV